MGNLIDGKISTKDLVYINLPVEYFNKFKLKKSDLLINRTNSADLVGKTALFDLDDNFVCASYLIRFVLNKTMVEPKFINYFFNTEKSKVYLKALSTKGVSQSNINPTVLKKSFKIPLPPLEEQKRIVEVLSTWDEAIEKMDQLISAKQKQFKWLLKILITDQQNNPTWKKVKLCDICEIITSPVDKKSIQGEVSVKLCNYMDVYYNNAIDSSISFMEATAKLGEIKRFKLIKNDVVITKDSETPSDIGVPAYVKENIGNLLCGYHLTILRPHKCVIGEYIYFVLSCPKIKYQFYKYANGVTRFGLTTESYEKINVFLPPLEEQKRIIGLLSNYEEEMKTLKQLSKKYQEQKKGLMQKLLTGKIRLQ